MMSDTNEREPVKPLNQSRVTTGIPHSGVHHDENPVNVFDKTSLEDAHTEGLINPVPNTVEGLGVYRPRTETQHESTSPFKRHLKKIIAVGALATVAIGIGVKEMTDKPERQTEARVESSLPDESSPASDGGTGNNESSSTNSSGLGDGNESEAEKLGEIQLPTAEDPQAYVDQIDFNINGGVNTGDFRYLDAAYAPEAVIKRRAAEENALKVKTYRTSIDDESWTMKIRTVVLEVVSSTPEQDILIAETWYIRDGLRTDPVEEFISKGRVIIKKYPGKKPGEVIKLVAGK